MKHTCQSRLWRCAERGFHPRYTVYATAGPKGVPFWVVLAPISGRIARVLRRDRFTHGEAMAEARAIAAKHYGRTRPQEVPC